MNKKQTVFFMTHLLYLFKRWVKIELSPNHVVDKSTLCYVCRPNVNRSNSFWPKDVGPHKPQSLAINSSGSCFKTLGEGAEGLWFFTSV